VYDADKIEKIPESLAKKYFLHSPRTQDFHVSPTLQEIILFRRLNLLHRPLPLKGPLDAIFCRNVMIYFDPELRQQLIEKFFGLLRPGGVLFLSRTESLAGIPSQFEIRAPSVFVRPAASMENVDDATQNNI
jgi:chemotaxis protein methyltransferase CheR